MRFDWKAPLSELCPTPLAVGKTWHSLAFIVSLRSSGDSRLDTITPPSRAMMDSIVSRGSDASMVTRERLIVACKNAGGDQSDVGTEGWVVEDGRRGAADGLLCMARHSELVESLRLPGSSTPVDALCLYSRQVCVPVYRGVDCRRLRRAILPYRWVAPESSPPWAT
jgi:hypothetical protein